MTKCELRLAIIKAVNDEEEFPGDMPDDMFDALTAMNPEQLAEAMRISTRLTKSNIIERISEVFNSNKMKKEMAECAAHYSKEK